MVEHLVRFLNHSIVFFFLLLPMMIIGAIILLPICYFMPNERIKLPFLFKWWDNVDAYIGRDTSVYRSVCLKGWFARYNWIALRNPVNYFDYVHLGLNWDGYENYTHYDKNGDDIGDGKKAGFRYIEVDQDGKTFYEYYWIWLYPFAKKYCIRYRLGWKIGNDNNPKGTTSQWCLVFSPFHPYTGK